MDPVASYLDMGGYARFVWPAFALTLIVLVALLVESLRSLRQRQRRLEALQGAASRGRTMAVGERP